MGNLRTTRGRWATLPPVTDAARGSSEAERGRAVLSLGILALRWVSLGWMVILALTAGELRRPALAVATIAGLAAWTGWLTVARPRPAAIASGPEAM